MKGYSTKSSDWEAIYPIGSIYMSVNSTSPVTLFGGTWVQLKDRFLLGAGSSYSNGATGGTNSHTHDLSNGYGKMSSSGNYLHWNYKYVDTYNTNWTLGVTSSSNATNSLGDGMDLGGNTGSTSNMPPYLVVYIWKRTA